MRLLSKIIILLLVPCSFCSAQKSDSASAVGSSHFKINGSKKFWMGSNYRKEWITPVKSPVLNMATEHGGLTPKKKGGGKQTKSLQVEDPNGRVYTFRSIQKFITSKTLPADLQSEAAEDLVADGVSASYPYAALSMTVLSEAAGVPHGDPKLVYIPDDPRLGAFQKDFANTMVLYEEKLPDSVKKAYDTDEVAEKLQDDNDNEVDQLAMLRVRLLDMYVLDLDRHEGQWNWGAYDKEKGKVFYPIAKDRDQAFYINQGILPGIVKWPWLVPQLQGFRAKAKNINRFNTAAANLDRFFLNKLSEQDWKKTAEDLLAHMTDDVIEKALDRQPYEIRDISAGKIKQTLKDRRSYLADEAMQYYRFLAGIVSVTGSDKKELFDITRNADGSVLLKVFKISKEGETSSKMFERTFDPQVTKELRLYGLGGDDKFEVHGNENKIKIRAIGGIGEDNFEATGSDGKGILAYDLKNEQNKITGHFKDKTANDTLVNSFKRLGYKYNQVIPFISGNYNSDDGLFLGASLKVIRQGFRKTPFKSMQEFVINHALSTNSYNFKYYSEHTGVLGKNGDLLFDADIKAPNNTINFFGYGATSVYDKSKPGKFKYYRARFNLGDISLLMRQNFGEHVTLTLGPTFEFYSLKASNNAGRYVITAPTNGLDPATLYSKQSYFGGKLSLVVDTRNNKVIPLRGIFWQTGLRVLSGTNTASSNITQLNSELTFYLSLMPKTIIFTNRFGYGHNFNSKFEFFHAQFLGSEDNLRGYRKFRFAGQSKLFNNSELRIRLANFKTYLFPGALGILGFFDTGRVWIPSDPSTKWLSGYGGGFWFSPLKRMVLTLTYATSKEDKMMLVGLGWKF